MVWASLPRALPRCHSYLCAAGFCVFEAAANPLALAGRGASAADADRLPTQVTLVTHSTPLRHSQALLNGIDPLAGGVDGIPPSTAVPLRGLPDVCPPHGITDLSLSSINVERSHTGERLRHVALGGHGAAAAVLAVAAHPTLPMVASLDSTGDVLVWTSPLLSAPRLSGYAEHASGYPPGTPHTAAPPPGTSSTAAGAALPPRTPPPSAALPHGTPSALPFGASPCLTDFTISSPSDDGDGADGDADTAGGGPPAGDTAGGRRPARVALPSSVSRPPPTPSLPPPPTPPPSFLPFFGTGMLRCEAHVYLSGCALAWLSVEPPTLLVASRHGVVLLTRGAAGGFGHAAWECDTAAAIPWGEGAEGAVPGREAPPAEMPPGGDGAFWMCAELGGDTTRGKSGIEGGPTAPAWPGGSLGVVFRGDTGETKVWQTVSRSAPSHPGIEWVGEVSLRAGDEAGIAAQHAALLRRLPGGGSSSPAGLLGSILSITPAGRCCFWAVQGDPSRTGGRNGAGVGGGGGGGWVSLPSLADSQLRATLCASVWLPGSGPVCSLTCHPTAARVAVVMRLYDGEAADQQQNPQQQNADLSRAQAGQRGEGWAVLCVIDCASALGAPVLDFVAGIDAPAPSRVAQTQAAPSPVVHSAPPRASSRLPAPARLPPPSAAAASRLPARTRPSHPAPAAPCEPAPLSAEGLRLVPAGDGPVCVWLSHDALAVCFARPSSGGGMAGGSPSTGAGHASPGSADDASATATMLVFEDRCGAGGIQNYTQGGIPNYGRGGGSAPSCVGHGPAMGVGELRRWCQVAELRLHAIPTAACALPQMQALVLASRSQLLLCTDWARLLRAHQTPRLVPEQLHVPAPAFARGAPASVDAPATASHAANGDRMPLDGGGGLGAEGMGWCPPQPPLPPPWHPLVLRDHLQLGDRACAAAAVSHLVKMLSACTDEATAAAGDEGTGGGAGIGLSGEGPGGVRRAALPGARARSDPPLDLFLGQAPHFDETLEDDPLPHAELKENLPDLSAPKENVPDLFAPKEEAPTEDLSDLFAPREDVSDLFAPKEKAAELFAPNEDAPKEDVSDLFAPREDVSELFAPKEDVSDLLAPQQDPPASKKEPPAPKDDVSDFFAPREDVSDLFAPRSHPLEPSAAAEAAAAKAAAAPSTGGASGASALAEASSALARALSVAPAMVPTAAGISAGELAGVGRLMAAHRAVAAAGSALDGFGEGFVLRAFSAWEGRDTAGGRAAGGTPRGGDAAGILSAGKAHACPDLPPRVSAVEVAWALQSDCHSTLLDLCLDRLGDHSWPALRSVGAGLWLPAGDALLRAVDGAAKAAFSASKDPEACALFYLALGKKRALVALCRAVQNTKLHDFLSNDFALPRWKSAALKNAFSLLTKQKYELAVAFFLLAEDVDAAVRVCTRQLADLQLAVVLCRLFAAREPGMLPRIAREELLPHAHHTGDCWLAATAHLLAKEPLNAITALAGASGRLDAPSTEPASPGLAASASMASLASISSGMSTGASSRDSEAGSEMRGGRGGSVAGLSAEGRGRSLAVGLASLPQEPSDPRTRLLRVCAYEPAAAVAFVRSLLASPLLRLTQQAAPAAACGSPAQVSRTSSHPPSTGDALPPPPPLPLPLLQHSMDAFCRGGCITLAASALRHFTDASHTHERQATRVRRRLAAAYALQAANALACDGGVWPPAADGSLTQVHARLGCAAPELAARLSGCAAQLRIRPWEVFRDVVSRVRDARTRELTPLAGCLLLQAVGGRLGAHGEGTSRGGVCGVAGGPAGSGATAPAAAARVAPSCALPPSDPTAARGSFPPADIRTPACAHAAACAARCRAVLSGRLPTELSARECVELLGVVAAVIASHALAASTPSADHSPINSPTHTRSPTRLHPHSPTRRLPRPPHTPGTDATLHDEASASVALIAVAVRLDDLETLLRCVRSGTSGPRLLFGSPGLVGGCWDRLWRGAVVAVAGRSSDPAQATAQGKPPAGVKRVGRFGAKLATPGALPPAALSPLAGISAAAPSLAAGASGGADCGSDEAAYVRARLLLAILQRVERATPGDDASANSSPAGSPSATAAPSPREHSARSLGSPPSPSSLPARAASSGLTAAAVAAAAAASLSPRPAPAADRVPKPIALPRRRLVLPVACPDEPPLSDPSAALPYGIHALLRQWSSLLQTRLGSLAAQLTMDSFPLDAMPPQLGGEAYRSCLDSLWSSLGDGPAPPPFFGQDQPASTVGGRPRATAPAASGPSPLNPQPPHRHQLWPLAGDDSTRRPFEAPDPTRRSTGDTGGGPAPVRLSAAITLLRRKGDFVRAACVNALNASQLAVAFTRGVHQIELVSEIGTFHEGGRAAMAGAGSRPGTPAGTGGGQWAMWGIGLKNAARPLVSLLDSPRGAGGGTPLTVHSQSSGSQIVARCLCSHPKVRGLHGGAQACFIGGSRGLCSPTLASTPLHTFRCSPLPCSSPSACWVSIPTPPFTPPRLQHSPRSPSPSWHSSFPPLALRATWLTATLPPTSIPPCPLTPPPSPPAALPVPHRRRLPHPVLAIGGKHYSLTFLTPYNTPLFPPRSCPSTSPAATPLFNAGSLVRRCRASGSTTTYARATPSRPPPAPPPRPPPSASARAPSSSHASTTRAGSGCGGCRAAEQTAGALAACRLPASSATPAVAPTCATSTTRWCSRQPARAARTPRACACGTRCCPQRRRGWPRAPPTPRAGPAWPSPPGSARSSRVARVGTWPSSTCVSARSGTSGAHTRWPSGASAWTMGGSTLFRPRPTATSSCGTCRSRMRGWGTGGGCTSRTRSPRSSSRRAPRSAALTASHVWSMTGPGWLQAAPMDGSHASATECSITGSSS